jgi:uncharacterized protein DUF4126
VELAVVLGRTIAFALAAGVNVYATVALIGLSVRFGWVDLPPQYDAFGSDLVIGAAAVMYLLEFFADKVPYVDTLWDVVHTVIRPVGGALIAVTSLGEASPAAVSLAALLGGAVATSSHLTKASTRAVANTSPEPFSNWALSLVEDAFAFGLGYLALTHPLAALVVALVVLGCILAFSVAILRLAARWLGRWRRAAPALH